MLFFHASYCYSDLMRLWIEEFSRDKIFLINSWSVTWKATANPYTRFIMSYTLSAIYLEESVQNFFFFWYKKRKEAAVSSEQKKLLLLGSNQL